MDCQYKLVSILYLLTQITERTYFSKFERQSVLTVPFSVCLSPDFCLVDDISVYVCVSNPSTCMSLCVCVSAYVHVCVCMLCPSRFHSVCACVTLWAATECVCVCDASVTEAVLNVKRSRTHRERQIAFYCPVNITKGCECLCLCVWLGCGWWGKCTFLYNLFFRISFERQSFCFNVADS